MKKVNKIVLSMIVVGLVSGCSQNNKSTDSTVENEKKPVAAYEKPSAPITMSYVISKENIQPGDEFEVTLNFQSKVNSAIAVDANSFEKLNLLNEKKNWQSAFAKSGSRDALPSMKIMAPESGTFYIRLVASVEADGKTMVKPFIIPVSIGDGAINLEQPGEVVIDDKGQKVIIQKGDSGN